MALLRLVHAASLPDPSELARMLSQGGGFAGGSAPAQEHGAGASSAPVAQQATVPATFEALVKQLWEANQALVADEMEHLVRPVRYAPPELDFQPIRPMDRETIDRMKQAIDAVTGLRWQLSAVGGEAQPSLAEQKAAVEEAAKNAILSTPVLKAAMEAFPNAELLPVDDDMKWSASA